MLPAGGDSMSGRYQKPCVFLLLFCLLIASLACGLPAALQDRDGDSLLLVITSPQDGEVFSPGDTIDVVFSVLYEPGLERVELIVDGTKVSEISPSENSASSFTATLSWTAEEEGTFVLVLVPYGSGNTLLTPSYLGIIVSQPAEAAGPQGTQAPAPTPEIPATGSNCTMNAAFVSDVSIPDGSEFAAGTSFTKTWRIRNSGTCAWDNVQLVFSSGSQMNGPSSISVPVTAPGADVDVSVNLRAPSSPADYTGTWRLNSGGTAFGTNLIVVITVPGSSAASTTPTTEVIPGFFGGIRYVDIVEQSVTTRPGFASAATAVCPSGSVVTGGGFTSGDSVVFDNTRAMNGWRVDTFNDTASADTVTSYAVCLFGTSATSTQVSNQISIAGNVSGRAVAACPAGSVVTGGGWTTTFDATLIITSSRKDNNNWQVEAVNTSGATQTLTAHAVCVSGISAHSVQESNDVSQNQNFIYSAATCSSGLMTGGGFQTNRYLLVQANWPEKDAAPPYVLHWRTGGENSTAATNVLSSNAVCLIFE